MAQSGIALSIADQIEIVSLYASAAERVDAVATAPGWTVVGGFPMPTTASIRLEVLGSVSDASLLMSIQLYCTTPGFVGVVAGSNVAISSLSDVSAYSSVFDLAGGRQYQVQAQVVGNAGSSYFGNVRRAAPSGA